MATPESERDTTGLYQGLKALSESTFPKKCGMCGHVYHSVDEFIAESDLVFSGSGLKESSDDDDKPIVELFRNCICGSTLMDYFSDRRDLSDAGLKRRKAFLNMQELLKKNGLSPAEARQELLKVMRGVKSKTLENLGIRIR